MAGHATNPLPGSGGSDQIHDPVAARPVGLDVFWRFLGTELPAGFTSLPRLEILCSTRGSAAFPRTGGRSAGKGSSGWIWRSTGGRPPAPGTSEKRLRGVQRIGLDQHTLQIEAAQQFLERSLLTGFMGVIGLLRQGNAQRAGVDGDLSNEPVITILGLDGRAPQDLTVADQLFQIASPTWDLADHPGLHNLPEFLQMGLIEQVEEGGIGGPALESQAQRDIQSLSVPFGECLQIT